MTDQPTGDPTLLPGPADAADADDPTTPPTAPPPTEPTEPKAPRAPKLADGITEDRATGQAVYDTTMLRFVTGPRSADDKLPDGVKVTASGRYQLRRV